MAIDVSAIATVNTWLAAIPSGGEPLRLDDDGLCRVTDGRGNHCLVYVPYSGHDVVLHADIAHVDEPDGARFHEALRAHDMLRETKQGAALSFDAHEQTVVLRSRIALQALCEGAFVYAIENFLVAVWQAKDRVQELAASLAEPMTITRG